MHSQYDELTHTREQLEADLMKEKEYVQSYTTTHPSTAFFVFLPSLISLPFSFPFPLHTHTYTHTHYTAQCQSYRVSCTVWMETSMRNKRSSSVRHTIWKQPMRGRENCTTTYRSVRTKKEHRNSSYCVTAGALLILGLALFLLCCIAIGST